MYHYIDDKIVINEMKQLGCGVVSQLVQIINNDNYLKVKADLVGSGKRNLITQNGKEPIDLDFNLWIKKVYGGKQESKIKEYVRMKFDEVLKKRNWGTCSDSTSALTTKFCTLSDSKKTKFSIDIAIVKEEDNKWFRLKHEKTGDTKTDRWFWNEGPNSEGLSPKIKWISSNGKKNELRKAYLKKKNFYLKRNDYDHPSFICYIESINEIYYKYNNEISNKTDNKKTMIKNEKTSNKTLNVALNMKYGDEGKKTFYCCYRIENNNEVKSCLYKNDTTIEDDYQLTLRWFHKLITAILKTTKQKKIVITTSPYILEFIVENKIGNRNMNEEELNQLKSFNGRIVKEKLEINFRKVN